MHSKKTGASIVALLTLALALPATALDPAKEDAFRRIKILTMRSLTRDAKAALEKKYPNEDWDRYDFPSYVYTDESVELGYKIAVKEPENLKVSVCACFCDEMGHRDLSYCFLKSGEIENGFDEHAVGCNICVRQAMMAFLWSELGATPEEIQAGMKDKYGVDPPR